MNLERPSTQLLFSTVRIEAQILTGISTGTGFIFNYAWGDKEANFLVTNKHVIKDSHTGKFFFTLNDGTQPLIGHRYDFQITDFSKAWHSHPNDEIDVAVMPLTSILQHFQNNNINIFYKSIPHTLIPTNEQIEEFDAVEEIIFIGYPNGMYDAKNLLPIARRGTTATSFQVDYSGKPLFLIDASVFPGSSGSPVFIYNPGAYPSSKGFVIGTRIFFLGIVAQVAIQETRGKIEFTTNTTLYTPIPVTNQMIDLGFVYKPTTIIEAITDLLRTKGEL